MIADNNFIDIRDYPGAIPKIMKFPEDQLILAAVSEGLCPICHSRLDHLDGPQTGRCVAIPDPMLAQGACKPCNSVWEVSADDWTHLPYQVELAGKLYNCCTCYNKVSRDAERAREDKVSPSPDGG